LGDSGQDGQQGADRCGRSPATPKSSASRLNWTALVIKAHSRLRGNASHPMILTKFLSKQLCHPSGIIGRVVLPRLFNSRNAVLNDFTLECLALQPNDRVLEVGFGGGYLLGRMATIITDGTIAGIDVSPAMVAFCEKRYRSLIRDGRLDIRCASVEALPYPPEYFTQVCTVNTIFYWRNASQAISELWRVLADSGTLVICFTCKKSLENRKFTKHGIVLYEVDQVHQLMESAGFHKINMVRGSDRHREFICAIGKK
jgi:ubiquinone/menaquinone biosynthesis C-methylase UbiE